ncbi:hypothetical protein [Mycolicibacterium llatzerense]|nr:hypothetical protein [Mycolicibacterium llatzerense]
MTETAQTFTRQGFCPGCGYYFAVNNAHRADCTCPPETPDDQ